MPSAAAGTTIVKVDASLLAGRPASFRDHNFWSTLFPQTSLTIEGRVPVPDSESYLLNSRLNSGRELVAVSFKPSQSVDRSQYDELSEGLLAKGYVFVWFQYLISEAHYHVGATL